jgi:hypothetical protein
MSELRAPASTHHHTHSHTHKHTHSHSHTHSHTRTHNTHTHAHTHTRLCRRRGLCGSGSSRPYLCGLSTWRCPSRKIEVDPSPMPRGTLGVMIITSRFYVSSSRAIVESACNCNRLPFPSPLQSFVPIVGWESHPKMYIMMSGTLICCLEFHIIYWGEVGWGGLGRGAG